MLSSKDLSLTYSFYFTQKRINFMNDLTSTSYCKIVKLEDNSFTQCFTYSVIQQPFKFEVNVNIVLKARYTKSSKIPSLHRVASE